MKNSTKVTFLIESGISLNTISKMNQNQINLMVERFKKSKKKEEKEAVTVTKGTTQTTTPTQITGDGKVRVDNTVMDVQGTIKVDANQNTKIEPLNLEETEITEDETNDVTSSNALGLDALQSYTGQEAPHDANDEACDGMDDDSCNNRSEEGIAESKINEKFESKAQQGLFWARCNKCSSKNCKWCKMAKEFSDSTTKKEYKKMPKKKHPEKTVKYKKKETKEETQKYWENKILEMLEEEKKKKQSKKKESETMILRKPKKMTMFSDEAPMELPIGRMFSIGKK